jgi:hypothetical protein
MIDRAVEAFLRACRASGVDFARTAMLGRQQLADGSYAEPLFEELGAVSVESIDASDFEGATVVADLNEPLPAMLRRRFSAVVDGGTLEHVFDIATALRSSLDLVEQGGHYIAVSPANNWPGHGFYQLSPELLFRVMSRSSGYRVRGAFVVEIRSGHRWYRIVDPESIGERLHWQNAAPTLLVMVGKREDLVDLAEFTPQQSDYVKRWQGQPGGVSGKSLRRAVATIAPRPVRDAYRSINRSRSARIRPPKFTRVAVARLADAID